MLFENVAIPESCMFLEADAVDALKLANVSQRWTTIRQFLTHRMTTHSSIQTQMLIKYNTLLNCPYMSRSYLP